MRFEFVRAGEHGMNVKTLKRDLPFDRKYDTRIEARQELFKFIELVLQYQGVAFAYRQPIARGI